MVRGNVYTGRMDEGARRPSLRRRIRDGLIGSVEELKAEFKAQAKRTHPDLAGSGAAEDFLRLRRDYEAALRALSAPASATGAGVEDDPFVALGLLLKRGFPKVPRHDKERLRYGYQRIRARASLGALNEEAGPLFDRFEEELFSLKETDARGFRTAMRLTADIVAARLRGTEALLAALRMELARRAAPLALGRPPGGSGDGKNLGPATTAFLKLLAGA